MANTPTTVVQSLGLNRFLHPNQLRELAALAKRFPEPRTLLPELQRRGWLTAFQAQQLAQGKGGELMLGPYRLLDRLGEGGVGQVFKAVHEKQNFLVALKVLKKDVQTDADTVGRFRREIEAISQVDHPNIVRAYEAGTAAGHLFLAMEYVEGIDLDRLIKQAGPLPPAKACAYIRQAALALQHAHERGLIHRDIKPANLLVCGGDQAQIKLLDLGLARLLQPKAGSTTNNLTMLAGSSVTHGTPDYLAPEQAIDLRSADIRADIYSLGCTLFYVVTGQPPFAGGSFAEKLMKHHQATPPFLTSLRPKLSPALDEIVQRMLAKRPADRYQTPGEVAQALAGLADGAPVAPPRPQKRIPRPVLVGVPLLALALLGGWLLLPGQRQTPGTPTAASPPTDATAPNPQNPIASASTRTVILQGREHIVDTLLDFSKGSFPFGSVARDNQLIRGGQSTVFLVRFALDKMPASTRVEQATLSFYVWDPHEKNSAKTGVLAVKSPWREAQATWHQPLAGVKWLGGDQFVREQDAGPLLGYAVVRPDVGSDVADPPIEYQIDVTTAVRDWVGGTTPNHGFALSSIPDRLIDGGHASRFQINASEHNRPEHTPKLTLRVQP